MKNYLKIKPDYIKCKSLWDAYNFLAHLTWQYLKAEQDEKEHIYYIDDVQISLEYEEEHYEQWANISWSYHIEKLNLILKRIENGNEITYECSSLVHEKDQSCFSLSYFMNEHHLSIPDKEEILSLNFRNMIPVTLSEDVSMPETDCKNDEEEPNLPKAGKPINADVVEIKNTKPDTVGNLSFSEFIDFMCQDEILNETQMFMRCFDKDILFDSVEKPEMKLIFRTDSVWKARLFLKNFYEKYSGLDLNKVMTVIKEEWIKECFILSNYIDHFRSLDSDKELWLLAYFLECSTWYGFASVVTPTKLGLPEERKAVEYYHLLKIMMDQDLQDSGDEGNEGDEGSDESDNSDDVGSGGENNQNGDGSGEDNDTTDDGSGGENDQSSEGSDGKNDSDESSDGSDGEEQEGDKPDNDGSSGKDADGEGSDGDSPKKDSYSLDDIINALKKHGISNSDLEVMRASLENAEEYADPSCCKSLPFDNLSLESYKKNQTDDKIEELFKKICKHITTVENDVQITKCSSRPSYHKYSWKTDARADGIVYPGNKRISGGLTRKFKNAPVVFFDFSGSTCDLNQYLNDLAYKFWTEGYTVCIYNHNLVRVVEPGDSSFFRFPSDGGTNTLNSVRKYFESKGVSDEDRNIYAITDGMEQYEYLFEKYRRATIFQICAGCKQLFKLFPDKDKNIQTVEL
jgi:hypothetical protein